MPDSSDIELTHINEADIISSNIVSFSLMSIEITRTAGVASLQLPAKYSKLPDDLIG